MARRLLYCQVMTIAAKRLQVERTLLFVIFALGEAALVTWFLSWTDTPFLPWTLGP